MRHLRLLLVVCALAFSLALALLKAPGARATAAAAPQPTPARHLQSSLAFGLRVVSFAKRFVGVRYVYGGSSPRSGFDCSGFVRYVYAHFGVALPHSSYAQFGDGSRVSRGHLRPGDLVFFDGLGHVGLYVGNGRFIHAPHTGTRVRVQSLAGWYSSRYVGARRLRHA
ncbi:MAG TPA: C40 family peptidase [Gaiellaceae bacterium]|nr:C40 family peptidase [Gaiellaceae bacterium]